MESSYYEYWLSVLGVCFSLLILSLSWVSVYWIKGIRHKLMAYIPMSWVYYFILNMNLMGVANAKMSGDSYGLFLSEALEYHSIFGVIIVYTNEYWGVFVLILLSYLAYGVYLLMSHFKNKKFT